MQAYEQSLEKKATKVRVLINVINYYTNAGNHYAIGKIAEIVPGPYFSNQELLEVGKEISTCVDKKNFDLSIPEVVDFFKDGQVDKVLKEVQVVFYITEYRAPRPEDIVKYGGVRQNLNKIAGTFLAAFVRCTSI